MWLFVWKENYNVSSSASLSLSPQMLSPIYLTNEREGRTCWRTCWYLSFSDWVSESLRLAQGHVRSLLKFQDVSHPGRGTIRRFWSLGFSVIKQRQRMLLVRSGKHSVRKTFKVTLSFDAWKLNTAGKKLRRTHKWNSFRYVYLIVDEL